MVLFSSILLAISLNQPKKKRGMQQLTILLSLALPLTIDSTVTTTVSSTSTRIGISLTVINAETCRDTIATAISQRLGGSASDSSVMDCSSLFMANFSGQHKQIEMNMLQLRPDQQ